MNVMALIPTATKTTREYVRMKLGRCNPVIISKSPNKLNIKYVVHRKASTNSDMMSPILDELKEHRIAMPGVIIFARSY